MKLINLIGWGLIFLPFVLSFFLVARDYGYETAISVFGFVVGVVVIIVLGFWLIDYGEPEEELSR